MIYIENDAALVCFRKIFCGNINNRVHIAGRKNCLTHFRQRFRTLFACRGKQCRHFYLCRNKAGQNRHQKHDGKGDGVSCNGKIQGEIGEGKEEIYPDNAAD